MSVSRGLTLGKFAPLHAGHQLVIETALAEVQELVVLIYDSPQVTDVALSVRAGWLRSLYPSVEVIEVHDGPSEVGYTVEIMAAQEACILRALNGRTISHFYSSEAYGEHVSRALGAVDCRVDPQRRTHCICATAIRGDAYRHRHFLSPIVYSALITNVVLLGGPSTGKTTLAAALADRHETNWMPEYGREYWHKHQVDRRLTEAQLVSLAHGHLSREDAALGEARRYLFTDTNAITTAVYSQYYHATVGAPLQRLCVEACKRYDLVFLCGADIPYEETADRSGEGNRLELQQRTITMLNDLGIDYQLLEGTLDRRLHCVNRTLARASGLRCEPRKSIAKAR